MGVAGHNRVKLVEEYGDYKETLPITFCGCWQLHTASTNQFVIRVKIKGGDCMEKSLNLGKKGVNVGGCLEKGDRLKKEPTGAV